MQPNSTDASDARMSAAVRAAATPLSGAPDDYDALLERIGNARFVLLGEASHGTHEFYAERARITRRLIEEKGFDAVVIEGDWPDAWRVNRFVRGVSQDDSPSAALAGFERFPTWMWRNTVVRDFVAWLRVRNAALPAGRPATGFYGMDLYSMHGSMDAVLGYLQQADPEAAQVARERYACFDRFGDDSQLYGLMTGVHREGSCEEAVTRMLAELHERAKLAAASSGPVDAEAAFDAEQNARLVNNAERYYRSMYLGDERSWNLRDRHMVETIESIERHLASGRPGADGVAPRLVVWAHNSHLGDARATEMGRRGEWNVGQLMRERHPGETVLIGFSTHTGTVTAASQWDGAAERKRVVPSRRDSYERLMHDAGLGRFVLPLRDGGAHVKALESGRLTRAIGVIYRPETERQSHYFNARWPGQFDELIHIDETHALQPLETNVEWRSGHEVPETYPTGL